MLSLLCVDGPHSWHSVHPRIACGCVETSACFRGVAPSNGLIGRHHRSATGRLDLCSRIMEACGSTDSPRTRPHAGYKRGKAVARPTQDVGDGHGSIAHPVAAPAEASTSTATPSPAPTDGGGGARPASRWSMITGDALIEVFRFLPATDLCSVWYAVVCGCGCRGWLA